MKKKILQRKVNLKRTCLVVWGLLMMQTAAFAIEHVHPEINFYIWNENENGWSTAAYSDGSSLPYLLTFLAWDFSSSITLENGDGIDLFYCINDEDPTTVSIVPAYAVMIYMPDREGFQNVYNRNIYYSSLELGEDGKPLESNMLDGEYLVSRKVELQEVNFQTLTIPETVTDETGKTYTVTKVGPYAFCQKAYNNLSSVVLPSTIKEIGRDVFRYQMNLSTVDMSDCSQLEKIEYGAFNRTGLTELNLLNNKKLNYLGPGICANCESLEKIYLPESLTDICGPMGLRGSPNLKEVYITSKISFIEYDSPSVTKQYGCSFGGSVNNAAIYVPLKYIDYYRTKHSQTDDADENGFFDSDDDIAKVYPMLEAGKLYRTFSYDKAVNLDAIEGLYNPSNTLKANIVTAIDVQNRRVTFTEKTGDVAPLEGIIIEGTGETGEFYPIKKYTGTTEPEALGDTENYLEGNGAEPLSFEDKKPAGGKQRYFIMKGGDFYYCTGGTLAKWKCYLDVREPISVYGSSVSQDAKFFSIFYEDEATPTTIKGITDVNTGGDSYYTLDGIRVSGQPQKKGIYVRNGRKVVVR